MIERISVATSGMCSDSSLRWCLDAMSTESVMFLIDYSFEKTDLAARFLETATLADAEGTRVATATAFFSLIATQQPTHRAVKHLRQGNALIESADRSI